MAYKLLGSGTTDSNGRPAYTHTCAGNSEIDVVVSLDNPISMRAVVPERYKVTPTRLKHYPNKT